MLPEWVWLRGQPYHHTLHTVLCTTTHVTRVGVTAGSALPPHFACCSLICAPLHMSPEWVLLCGVSPTTTLCMLLPCLCTSTHVARVGVTVQGQPYHHTLHATSLSVYRCTWWSWRPFSVFMNNKDSVFCIMMYLCHVKPLNSDRGTVVTYLMTTVLNWVSDWLNMWAPAHQSLSCREKGSSAVTALSSKYTQLTQYGCLYYNWLFLHKHKIDILGLGQNGIWVGCWTGLVNVR